MRPNDVAQDNDSGKFPPEKQACRNWRLPQFAPATIRRCPRNENGQCFARSQQRTESNPAHDVLTLSASVQRRRAWACDKFAA
jgi:hypothetical protein